MPIDDEVCTGCGTFEHLHVDGECPRLLQGDSPASNRHDGRDNLLPGNFKRKAGRPLGSKNRTLEERIAAQSIVFTKGALKRDLARKLQHQQDNALEEAGIKLGLEATRVPRNPAPLPNRTVADCKDAALKLISQQLWDLQGVAEERGLLEDEEARVLKLLAGFNAALPKQAEKPRPKALDEMNEDELREALKNS